MGDYSVKSSFTDNGFLLRCRPRQVFAKSGHHLGSYRNMSCQAVLFEMSLSVSEGCCKSTIVDCVQDPLDKEMVDFFLCVVSSYSYLVLLVCYTLVTSRFKH